MNGKVKFFGNKNFGFIIGDDGRDYFVHVSDLVDPNNLIQKDDSVNFEPVEGEKGFRATRCIKEVI